MGYPMPAVQATATRGGGGGRPVNAYATPAPYTNQGVPSYGSQASPYGQNPFASYGQYYNPSAATQQQQQGYSSPQQGQQLPQQSQPQSNGIAQVGSLIGSPQLPNSPQMLATYPNYQADQTFSQIGGPEYLMRQYGPSADQGMMPSASTQALVAPMLADRATNANLARNQTAYDLANQNANSLLDWQKLGAGSDLGQFQNLANLNNAQQNYNLGLFSNNLNYQNDLLNLYTQMLGGTMSGIGGMTGNLLGGMTGGVSDPTGALTGALGGSGSIMGGGYSDPTGALTGALGGVGDPTGLLAALYGGGGQNPLASVFGG